MIHFRVATAKDLNNNSTMEMEKENGFHIRI